MFDLIKCFSAILPYLLEAVEVSLNENEEDIIGFAITVVFVFSFSILPQSGGQEREEITGCLNGF